MSIQLGSRFIYEEARWIPRERARKHEPLGLSTREFFERLPGCVREIELRQDLLGGRVCAVARLSFGKKRKHYVIDDRALRHPVR